TQTSSFPVVPSQVCRLDRTASSHSDSELKAETSEPTETKQLSFAEVMRLVQEGKEVPGVTKVDIQPSNQNPTPSRMERMLKPWETTSSSPDNSHVPTAVQHKHTYSVSYKTDLHVLHRHHENNRWSK
uniref:Peroxisomal membrane protein PEX14-like KPWE domain-containing protein n=1 Tax=Oreochromis aureus TaxID=47969 RepID=A0A668SB77_OREAU